MKWQYPLAGLLLAISVCMAYSALQQNIHEFTVEQCPDCHAVTPVKGERRTLKMTAPIGSLCRRCHEKSIDDALSHPVDMVPVNIALPGDLPLSWEGLMTCSTCHNIHAAAPPGHGGKWFYLRRDVAGQPFCAACHREGPALPGMGHAQALSFAHMKYIEGGGGRIDGISMICLSCHDGTLGSATNIKVGTWRHGAPFSPANLQGSHPIGVNYRRAMMSRRGGLHPPERLNRKIKLIDGKVGCTSCHDINSREPMLLAISNDGAGLCLECHDK